MRSANNETWYEPIQNRFDTNRHTLNPKNFAAIEAVLYLMLTYAKSPEPEKAYLLFSEYQLIGMEQGSKQDYQLCMARKTLGFYRSKKYWQDDLQSYCSEEYDGIRAFDFIEDNGRTLLIKNTASFPYSYNDRMAEWERFWNSTYAQKESYPMADRGSYFYVSSDRKADITEKRRVTFTENSICEDITDFQSEECSRESMIISIAELLQCAEEMQQLNPDDYCFNVLKNNTLKAVNDGKVEICQQLNIHRVVNIIGMVGSGKSTLIKVLAYWINKNGKRAVIVLDTVAEVFYLWQYLDEINVSCSPLVGRSERLKYINQLFETDKFCLPEKLSKYLNNTCIVDGMNSGDGESPAYGKEPCYSLKSSVKGKAHLCPYFDYCNGTKMLRDCYTSSLVLTTVAGFAMSKIGKNRELFLETALKNFHLVIFDESDRVQKTLDQLFMPETSLDNFIAECKNDCSNYLSMNGSERERDRARQEYHNLQLKTVSVVDCVLKALNWNLGNWNKLTYGDPFSALTLLDNLKRDSRYAIPDNIYHRLYSLIDENNRKLESDDTLHIALSISCSELNFSNFNKLYSRWIDEEKGDFNRSLIKSKDIAVQDARIKLIICLIYFDHFIRQLNDAYTACHETSYGQNEIFAFLQARFKEQQQILPSALCGNLFGMKKNDKGDIIMFRQFAFGRSLMKDLPYLRLDAEGNPIGPHVIMLSGSSWVEGSYEYHINRPVNYILESDKEKREFLYKTRFYESGFTERVSGSGDDRTQNLRKVTEKSVDDIIKEYNRNAGKILIVVNSYKQCEEVAKVLESSLDKKRSAIKVCRMVSDAVMEKCDENIIRRGEVNRFPKTKYDILIAPAMAIERGHNIVDETGHSALGAVFFMVRPMSVPDDVQEKGSKLNGFVEAHCVKGKDETILNYNVRMRTEAVRRWRIVTGSGNYGLDNLDNDDKKDIVSTLFVLILQIFGRLARVTDTTKPEPHVYFMDGAFRKPADADTGFDCLSALGRYLESLMNDKNSYEIADTLYRPFFEAYKKGIAYD